MKKSIFVIIFLCFLPSLCEAQIKRNFDGIVIGVSNKNEVINYARKNWLSYYNKDGGERIVVLDESGNSIFFAGYNWDAIDFSFCDGVVYKVRYVMANSGRKVRDYHKYDKIFENIQKNLINKYSSNKSQALKTESYKIKDKKTQVEISLLHENRSHYLILNYFDINLSLKRSKKFINDL